MALDDPGELVSTLILRAWPDQPWTVRIWAIIGQLKCAQGLELPQQGFLVPFSSNCRHFPLFIAPLLPSTEEFYVVEASSKLHRLLYLRDHPVAIRPIRSYETLFPYRGAGHVHLDRDQLTLPASLVSTNLSRSIC